jgi:integrase
MKTNQRGIIYEASKSFYVRYFETRNGKRVRVSKKLCDFDQKKYYSADCPEVKYLRDQHMLAVNKPTTTASADPLITDFWREVYVPFMADDNLKPSTRGGYQQIWDQFLNDHFTERTLRTYETGDASDFLSDLAKRRGTDGKKKYGERTIAHVRSLGSGIFTLAVNKRVLTANPWHGVKIIGKVKPPKKTQAYNLTELIDIVNNKLKARVDAQLMVCLAGLMGLRPCEIVGLCWETVNLEACTLEVKQAVVRGVLGTTKTDADEDAEENVDATLPIIEPTLQLFKTWHMQSGQPSKGWVFPNQSGDPLHIRDYVAKVLKPAIGDGWKSLYAFRRGAASIVTQLTGSPIAASQLLRHKNMSVTMTAYIKADRRALVDGSKLVETQWKQLSAPKGEVTDC